MNLQPPPHLEFRQDKQYLTLYCNGTEQSRINVTNPEELDFEYMQHMDVAASELLGQNETARVAHVGAGACALALAWSKKWPRSTHVAFEVDEWLANNLRDVLPLPKKPTLRLRLQDGSEALQSSKASYDIIVRDAFDQAQVPSHLQTVEWNELVKSRLRTGGIYLANVAHGPSINGKPDLAAIRQVFPFVVAIGDKKVLHSARKGNIIAVASSDASLSARSLEQSLRRLPLPVQVADAEELEKLLGGARGFNDPSTL